MKGTRGIFLSKGEDRMNTCANGEHKRIEVTCLDCIERLRAEVQQLTNDMGTVKQAREMTDHAMASARAWEEECLARVKERDTALLQNRELKAVLRRWRFIHAKYANDFEGMQLEEDTRKVMGDDLREPEACAEMHGDYRCIGAQGHEGRHITARGIPWDTEKRNHEKG